MVIKRASCHSQFIYNFLAACFLDPHAARTCNEALMEFGERICTPKRPLCGKCPLNGLCLAFRWDTVAMRPVLLG